MLEEEKLFDLYVLNLQCTYSEAYCEMPTYFQL